jgi:hypothetical protein
MDVDAPSATSLPKKANGEGIHVGKLRSLTHAVLVLGGLAAATATPLAQWPKYTAPGVPMGADGKPNLDAPPPRLANGKPDLSGVWEIGRGRGGAAALGATGRRGAGPAASAAQSAPARGGTPTAVPAVGGAFGNIGANTEGGAPYLPWAAELVKKRVADNSKDNPDANCLPMGIGQLNAHIYPRKIISTPTEVVIIYEGSGTTVREIFLDGRALPKDPEPWWNGYSVGHWEGDSLVVETTGLMDDGWLDVRGSPITNKGKITERFRRPSYGTLELEEIIEDPSVYTKPFSARLNYRISTDTQLIEFVCLDKDASHYVGASTSAPGKTEAPK